MKRIAFLCATGMSLVLPACGSLDSNTDSAPLLATLQGNLTNPLSLDVSPSDVRVAIVWRGDGAERFSVAEDLPVRPVFPSSFTIGLDKPPPEEAMKTEFFSMPPPQTGPSAGGPPPSASGGTADGGTSLVDGSMPVVVLDKPAPQSASRFAIGTVVAYLDANHNGRLDLVADDASTFVDQIVAANQEMAIAYFEGPILDNQSFGYPLVDSAGHRPKDGYNLVQIPACTAEVVPSSNPACSSPPAAPSGGCVGALHWLGIDAPYALTLASNPVVARLMCLVQGGPGILETGSGPAGPFDPAVQPPSYPAPCDPNLSCALDGSEYLYATCMEISQGLCKGTLSSCTSVGVARPTPAPTDWPCLK